MNSEKQISLSNSQKMPLVGFGTYLISNKEAPSTVGNAPFKTMAKNIMFQNLKDYFAGQYKKVIQ